MRQFPFLKTKFTHRNNGTCSIVSITGFQCACPFGYTGPVCELSIDACTSNPCRFGTCRQLTAGLYFCQCSPGYTGFNCQTEINECSSTPCLNNGTCIDLINRFNCTCPTGYSGISLINVSFHRSQIFVLSIRSRITMPIGRISMQFWPLFKQWHMHRH